MTAMVIGSDVLTLFISYLLYLISFYFLINVMHQLNCKHHLHLGPEDYIFSLILF